MVKNFIFDLFFFFTASAQKSFFEKSDFFKKDWEEFFFSVKNRLPLTIFWSEIVSVIQGDPNTERGFKNQLYIELG